MASTTEIANLALSHLGVGKEIADLDTEASQEASSCRRFFAIARDATLRDFPWPFATKFVTLGLIEADPTDEWSYSYRYPSDCLMVRRILSGLRNDNRQSRQPFKIVQDSSGRLIYTDEVEASIEYTVLEDDPAKYPPDFTMALSLRLAAYAAPRVTGGDPFKMGQRAMQMYLDEISNARENSAMEQQDEEVVQSEFIRSRD